MAESGGTQAAGRVAEMLSLLLGSTDGLAVSEVARELGLPKSVVHRSLRSLVEHRLLATDEGTRRYTAGPVLVALGAKALSGYDLRAIALPHLQDLLDSTGETAVLSILVRRSRVHIVQLESPREVKMKPELGVPSPLYVGATARAMLARLPAAEQEEILSGPLESPTRHTPIDPAQVRARLAEVLQHGYSVSFGERQPDACAVAAPVRDLHGHVIAALSVCGPAWRFTDEVVERYGPIVRAAAGATERELGWVASG